jgi:hypothetical protein
VFADVRDIPINPRRHLLVNQIRLFGTTNHPSTGYPSSLRLLNKFKKTYPLEKFVTHEFPVQKVSEAMAQAFDIDACMMVVLTPSGRCRRGADISCGDEIEKSLRRKCTAERSGQG